MRKEREITVPRPRRPVVAEARVGRGRPAGRTARGRRRTGSRERLRYWVDRTVVRGVSALVGWLALACLAVVTPASTLLVWTDRRAPESFGGKLAAVWRTAGQTLRLGGEAGPPLRFALSLLLALVALLYVSTLVGIVTSALTERLTALQRGHSTVVEDGHTVVLGWSEQAPTVVAEVLAAHAQRRRGAVAVLADRDKAEMEAELRAGLTGGAARVRLLCRSGRPADPVALARIGPATAGAVVVLPSDGRPEPTGTYPHGPASAAGAWPDAGDAQVVKTLLALRAAAGDGEPVRVVAAVRDGRFRDAAALAAGEGATVLDVDDIAARLLAQCVREPGLSLVLEDLLDFAGAELHTLHDPRLAGRRFGAVRAGCPDACAVGIVRAGGGLLLNPAPGTEFGLGDALVVVAEDGGARAVSGTAPAAVDPSVMVTRERAGAPRPYRVVVLGWNRRGARVVGLLARGAAPGSSVDVFAPDGRLRTNGGTYAEGRGDGGDGGEDPGAVPVVFHRGDPLAAATVGRVDERYDHVVVLGPDRAPGTDQPDDHTLVTLLQLRAGEARTGRVLPLVAELADERNRAIAPAGPGADLVAGGRLVGLLMAQISQNAALAAAFAELFAPGGTSVRLWPAGDLVRHGAEASFATVVAAAARQGACAVGYRAAADADRPPRHGVRLNPPKGETRCWAVGDEVIVIAPADPEGANAAGGRSGMDGSDGRNGVGGVNPG
ncbi:CASTOR/POLLUX-related putative ion channel [Streptomyces laurentii]|uniref:CASTOR/POLLUX-related putative ion channel n=1 Tax=Streptomyces laurentii TaxID=39478 RepID=UPI003677B29A